MEVTINQATLLEPIELSELELYAVAGGAQFGFYQILRDIRSLEKGPDLTGGNVDINLIVVEVGNGNRVTTGSGSARGSTSGSSSVDVGSGNEIIIYT
jgi:hypothetical protein